MKVKITHTIGLDEVPDKIEELVHLVRARLVRLSKTPINLANMASFAHAASEIRDGLTIVDAQLEDAMGMLEGYKNVFEQMSQVPAPDDVDAPAQPGSTGGENDEL